MGWDDLNWLEDIHMGYEEGAPAVFDRNNNGWVRIPSSIDLPDNQQDRDMIARELLDQVSDVPGPSDGCSEQGLSQVLIRNALRIMIPLAARGEWDFFLSQSQSQSQSQSSVPRRVRPGRGVGREPAKS